MKISKGLIEKLLRLANGDSLTASECKSGAIAELCKDMLNEGILVSKSNGSFIKYHAKSEASLRCFIASYDDSLKNLEATLNLLNKDEVSRAEQVAAAGNSKIIASRSCKGFLINSYNCIEATLNNKPFEIRPPDGSFIFIADYENFTIPKNVIVVGVENMENFRFISKQKYLFDKFRSPILFVSRYPQSKDLINWLQMIENSYMHFGDLDLAGIHIYLTEFFNKIGKRASFFVPINFEEYLEMGSRERFDAQIKKFEKMQITDESILALVHAIKRVQKSYDQEGFIK